MSILSANLKLYSPFQKQSWLYKYVLFIQILSFFYLGIFINKLILKNEAPLIMLILPFMFIFTFGQMVSRVQLDALSKPFSYCLPNNEKIPRRVIFIIGIITALLSSSIAFLFYHPKELNLLITIIPIITLTSYILGVCISCDVTDDNKYKAIIMMLFLSSSVFLLISSIFFNKVLISYNDVAQYFLLPLLFSCILLIIASWIMLGDRELKRNCFEKTFNIAGKMPDAGSIDQLHSLNNSRFNQTLSDFNYSDSRIAMLFHKRMNMEHCFSVKHSLLGKLHYLFSRHFTMNGNDPILKLILVSLLFFISGYLGNDSTQINSIFTVRPVQLMPIFIMCFMLSSILAPSSHSLLLPEGRSIQYRVYFLLWLLKCFILIFMVIFVIGASWVFRGIMPEIDLFGSHIYSSIGLYAILWALIIMPVIDLMCSYVDIPYRLVLMIMLTSVLLILSSIAFFTSNIVVNTVLVIIMVLITNGLFVSLLTRRWFRCDHV